MIDLMIEEHKKNNDYPNHIYKEGPVFKEHAYDTEHKIILSIFEAPNDLKLVLGKVYSFTMDDGEDMNSYSYKVLKKINENTYILSEFYNDKLRTVEDKYVYEKVPRINALELYDLDLNKIPGRKHEISDIDLELTEVVPFSNDSYRGIKLLWTSNIGWGEYTIYQSANIENKMEWLGDSEHMDSIDDNDFLKELMRLFIEKISIE